MFCSSMAHKSMKLIKTCMRGFKNVIFLSIYTIYLFEQDMVAFLSAMHSKKSCCYCCCFVISRNECLFRDMAQAQGGLNPLQLSS